MTKKMNDHYKEKKLTIVTPTYNRGREIVNLYNSLYKQSSYNFKWLIIDDGSSDNTRNIIKDLKKDRFEINYVYKENQGKHTALNVAFSILDTELFVIVDSDDSLDCDAVKHIENDWEKYRHNSKICGLVYPRMYPNGIWICDKFKAGEFEENYNNYVINSNLKGDKSEVFRCEIFKNLRYPEYDGERFLGEGVLWSKIARKYNMIFISTPIYICNYLEGGLTKSGRQLRIKNPLGGMYHAEEYMDKIYTFKIREKNTLLYLTYAHFAKINFFDIFRDKKNKIMLLINWLPSMVLYLIWKIKFE